MFSNLSESLVGGDNNITNKLYNQVLGPIIKLGIHYNCKLVQKIK